MSKFSKKLEATPKILSAVLLDTSTLPEILLRLKYNVSKAVFSETSNTSKKLPSQLRYTIFVKASIPVKSEIDLLLTSTPPV